MNHIGEYVGKKIMKFCGGRSKGLELLPIRNIPNVSHAEGRRGPLKL